MKHRVLVVMMVLALGLTQTGCLGAKENSDAAGSSEEVKKPKKNTNPRKDWVKVFTLKDVDGYSYFDTIVYKRCNGLNLVYMSESNTDEASGGLSVIPNSEQCTKR